MLDGMRFEEMLTVNDPTPAFSAPVRLGCPLVNFVRIGVGLVGVHTEILGIALRSIRRFQLYSLDALCNAMLDSPLVPMLNDSTLHWWPKEADAVHEEPYVPTKEKSK